MPEASQGLNVARLASLRAGFPVEVPVGDDQSLLFVRTADDRARRAGDHDGHGETS